MQKVTLEGLEDEKIQKIELVPMPGCGLGDGTEVRISVNVPDSDVPVVVVLSYPEVAMIKDSTGNLELLLSKE